MIEKIKEIFGFAAPDSLTIEVREDTTANAFVPKAIPYVFRKDLMSIFLGWMMKAAGNDPLFIFGPTGSGKTSLPEQIAARIKMPFYVAGCHEGMEPPDLFGSWMVENGTMKWQDGPLLAGLRDPAGAWVLLNEGDTLRPACAIAIHRILEGRPITIPQTGEIFDPLKYGARIILDGNTAGFGDESGQYGGTNHQNKAFMGRFMMMEIGYPDPEDEMKVVRAAVPALPQTIAEWMIKLANDVRGAYRNGDTEVIFCSRSLIRWGQLYCFFRKKQDVVPLYFSLDHAIGLKYPAETRAGLHELVQRVFPGV